MFKQFIGFICFLSFCSAAAEVVDFYCPATSSGLKNMKLGPVTVAIIQGEGSKKPTADQDGMGNIEFYPKNVMSVTVADGYYLKAITIGTSQSVFMEPVDLSSGRLTETPDLVWTPDEGQITTSMTLINGNEDPSGKNRKYTSISVIQVEYDVPSADLMTPTIAEKDITLLDNGEFRVTVNLISAKYELYYRYAPLSREDAHDGFMLAEGNGKERLITLSGAGILTYYAYDPVAKVKGLELNLTIGDDGKSSLSVSSQAEAASVAFDLQGRRILNPLRSGIYILNGRKIFVRK